GANVRERLSQLSRHFQSDANCAKCNAQRADRVVAPGKHNTLQGALLVSLPRFDCHSPVFRAISASPHLTSLTASMLHLMTNVWTSQPTTTATLERNNSTIVIVVFGLIFSAHSVFPFLQK